MLELKGKPVADQIYQNISEEFKKWTSKNWNPPSLAVILVGENKASQVYVKNKQQACEKLGFRSRLITLPTTVSEAHLSDQIKELNANSSVDAILLQLPLPEHINSKNMTESIDASKDADALTTESMGKLMTGQQIVSSCTPAGIIEILKFYNIDIAGKEALVIGRSQIVGLPLFHLLNQLNATVTLAHSKTANLSSLLTRFDFVFVAVGRAHFLKVVEFKKGAVVVDVGIHRTSTGLIGDVDSAGAADYLSALTPVPGGVGPMTIAVLMQNTFKLAERIRKKDS